MQHIWIYPLTSPAPAQLEPALAQALASWQSHGRAIDSRITLVDEYFVVIEALSDNSGCGIDWLNRAVREVLQTQELHTQDASIVYYRDAQGQMQQVPFQQVPDLLAQGTLTPHTPVYDLTCVHRGTLQGLHTRVADCWLSRYLAPAQ